MENELKKNLDEARNESDTAFQNAPDNMTLREFENYMGPFYEKVSKFSRKLRLIMNPNYSKLPDYGNVMSLKEFKECCKEGYFIDYDGSGNYVKDGMMSNITILPSDVTENNVRTDFDTIIWFNK